VLLVIGLLSWLEVLLGLLRALQSSRVLDLLGLHVERGLWANGLEVREVYTLSSDDPCDHLATIQEIESRSQLDAARQHEIET